MVDAAGTTEKKRYIITTNDFCGRAERILNCFELYHVGICNRIKQLFTNMRLHSGQYDTVNIHWPVKGKVKSRFHDLFEFSAFPRINEINNSIFLDGKYCEEGTWQLWLRPEEFSELRKSGLQYLDFGYNDIPESFINLYKPYFMALKPSRYVQDVIDTVQIPENCVSVHMRHAADWKEWNRWGDNDINLFLEELHKYDSDTYFYLACPDKEVHEIFNNEFKGRILSIEMDYDTVDNVKDVADLFLLSKSKKLIGTYGSTYSECVWWLSGCSQDVTIIGSKDTWKNGGLPDYVKPKS